MTDIFREIEEDLRRDNLKKLWSRYGRYLIIVAVVALLAAGGVAVWRAHELSLRRQQSERYAAAFQLVNAGKSGEAAKVFAAIAGEGGGYGLLARFEEAALLAKNGKMGAAAALYDRLGKLAAERGMGITIHLSEVRQDLDYARELQQAINSEFLSALDRRLGAKRGHAVRKDLRGCVRISGLPFGQHGGHGAVQVRDCQMVLHRQVLQKIGIAQQHLIVSALEFRWARDIVIGRRQNHGNADPGVLLLDGVDVVFVGVLVSLKKLLVRYRPERLLPCTSRVI